MIDYARFIEHMFENEVTETNYGEPQIFIEFESGRYVEITHEQYELPEEEWFYSLRYQCNQKEFDNDMYHETIGIICTISCDGTISIAENLGMIINKYNEVIIPNQIEQFKEWDK